MGVDDEVAFREVAAMARDVWVDAPPAGLGEPVERLELPDLAGFERPSAGVWGRFTWILNFGEQNELSGANRRSFGIFNLQIFDDGDQGQAANLARARVVAQKFTNVHSPSGVWFRSVHPSDQEGEGQYQRVDVEGEFVYDTILP